MDKKSEMRPAAVCPKCGKTYTAPPALSRDNRTHICPDCGTREALDNIGVKAEEQERILETIHRCYQQ